jgi:hypothetical protein
MPVKALAPEYAGMTVTSTMYEELAAVTRQAFVPRLFVQIYETSPMLLTLQKEFLN